MTEVKAAAAVKRATRGRPALFETKRHIAKALHALKDGASLPYLHYRRLIAEGYVEAVAVVKETRGRRAHTYQLTGKGRGLVGISKSWKM